jgi:hypothetical protein
MRDYLRLIAGDDPKAMQREREARQPHTELLSPDWHSGAREGLLARWRAWQEANRR